MSDVNVLYLVTAIVVAGLVVWAGFILATAEDAPDESPVDGAQGDPALAPSDFQPKPARRGAVIPDETPPPATVEITVPAERAIAIAGKSAPVVVLPVMRSRLDSHSEISDDSAAALEFIGVPIAGAVDDEKAPDSLGQGPPLSLVSAIGRSTPAAGPTEMSAIVDRHRLFILADGGGQRVHDELVSAVLVDALAAAFDHGADAPYASRATLPRRADRLRRAVVAAMSVLRSRASDGGADLSRVGVLAAHFSPDNRNLYIATIGPDRAYRMRGPEVVQLNKASLVAAASGEGSAVDTIAVETAPNDVYVFGTDEAFLAVGDELRAVLTFDPSVERVAAHFVAAATREGKSAGMTAIVIRVNPPRSSVRPPAA